MLTSHKVSVPHAADQSCECAPQGRAGVTKVAMLEKLQQAVADIEQMKADLLSTGRPAKHPNMPGAATPKKKRKAQQVPPWARSVGQRAQPKHQPAKASAALYGTEPITCST